MINRIHTFGGGFVIGLRVCVQVNGPIIAVWGRGGGGLNKRGSLCHLTGPGKPVRKRAS